jgi:hypothetical protein
LLLCSSTRTLFDQDDVVSDDDQIVEHLRDRVTAGHAVGDRRGCGGLGGRVQNRHGQSGDHGGWQVTRERGHGWVARVIPVGRAGRVRAGPAPADRRIPDLSDGQPILGEDDSGGGDGYPAQGAITKDNMTLTVETVACFRVIDPVRAIINVQKVIVNPAHVCRVLGVCYVCAR